MTIQIIGGPPGIGPGPASDTNTTLYRFELVRGALVRERPNDARPRADRKRYLVDVLLNEDETGRYISGVRGFVVPRQGSAFGERRSFEVGSYLLLEVGRHLAVGPHGRQPPRLATLDGRRVG